LAGFNAWAKAQAYLRSKNNNSEARTEAGGEARAEARTTTQKARTIVLQNDRL
jgi:hypothetical protein